MGMEDQGLLMYGNVSQETIIDVGAHFITDLSFTTKEDLIEWARNIGKSLGFVIIIQRVDKLEKRAKPRVTLGCDRYGVVRQSQNPKKFIKKNIRKSSSKRCDCKFSLRGRKEDVNEWKVEVICGIHNHVMVHLEAHPYAGRLNISEQKIVEDLCNAGVKPRKILTTLKRRNPSNTTTMRTIYNEKAKIFRVELDGGTPIQFLYKCITDYGYTSFNVVGENTNQLTSLYFAHPTSVILSNMFSSTFLMDCTYKTNRFRLPLFCIVGITSTNQSFFSSFSFMPDETESSYRWALECFKSLFNENVLPICFVTDRELALMNAIKSVFPQAKNLLCRVHISRNILAHCKKYFTTGKDCDIFLAKWQQLVEAKTENDYNMRFNEMISDYSLKYPSVISYVTTTWLEPYKEYFISTWIDKYLHLGNTSTNRVEGGHSQLKKFLEVSIGNLTTVWKTFHQLLILQHTEIKKMFGQSKLHVSTSFKSMLYSELVGNISMCSLEIIKKEELSINSCYVESENCLHTKRYTLGLPCGHELFPYISGCNPFPLWMIHKHWRQLSLVESQHVPPIKEEDVERNDLDNDIEGLLMRYKECSDLQKRELKRKLRELVNPTLTQTKEPKMPKKLRGRPKGSLKKMLDDYKSTKREPSLFEHVLMLDQIPTKNNSMKLNMKKAARRVVGTRNNLVDRVLSQMPANISKHIVDVVDVMGDGHCGYRVISIAMDMGDSWLQVRHDLSIELKQNEDLYNNVFGLSRRMELLSSLDCHIIPAPVDKWMSMPDMGLIISSFYNVQVIHFSRQQSFTFLPLHSAPPTCRKTIHIGFVDDNHFVLLKMREDSPIPWLFPVWSRYHDDTAEEWGIPYVTNIDD